MKQPIKNANPWPNSDVDLADMPASQLLACRMRAWLRSEGEPLARLDAEVARRGGLGAVRAEGSKDSLEVQFQAAKKANKGAPIVGREAVIAKLKGES